MLRRPLTRPLDVARRALARVDLGVAGAALAMLCAAAAFAVVSRPLGTPDEVGHIDYAYQLWHGHLPVFENGVMWHPPAETPPVQYEAQHPPLFYLLLAPVVGPLASSGHWLTATIAARLICVLIAVGAVLALAWAASLVTTRHRRAWAIVVPSVLVPVTPFLRVGGSAYNDNLCVGLIALAMGISFLIIRNGPTRGRVIAAAVVCALGMLSRAEFGIALVLVSASLALGVLIASDPRRRRLALVPRATLLATVPGVSAFAAAGWFYLRNKRITGSFAGGHPDWAREHLHRYPRSISSILHAHWFWNAQVELLHEYKGDYDAEHRLIAALAVLTVIAVVVALARIRRFDVRQFAIFALLMALAGATLLSEIVYISGGGGLNARYLLPALLPIGCFLAFGIVSLPRLLRPLAQLGYLAGAWWIFIRWITDQHPDGPRLWRARTLGHVPWAVVVVALVGLVVGLVLQVVGLYLAKDEPRTSESAAAGTPRRRRSPSDAAEQSSQAEDRSARAAQVS